MASENGFIRSIIDELHYWDIQGEQMAEEIGGTQIVID